MQYRRAWIPGGSYFFTVVTDHRRPLLATESAVEVLRQAIRTVRAKRPFAVDAMVVLPDHLHCIWTLPPGDADFATRWRLIKTWFTKHCDPGLLNMASGYAALTRPTGVGTATSGYAALTRPTDVGAEVANAVWQNRYWEHVLRDEADYERHADYIHYNPVKHGLVASAGDWPYSSFRRFVTVGLYPKNWGQGVLAFDGVGHE
jgi:putative transposase